MTKIKKRKRNKKVCQKKESLIFRSISNRGKNKLFKKKKDVDSLKEDQNEFFKNNKLILKTQKIFKSESHNVFTEEIMKIVSNSSDDKKNVVN